MTEENNVVVGLLVAGGITAGVLYLVLNPPARAQKTNLVSNSGFEENGVGWTTAQNGTNAVFALEPTLYGKSISVEYITNTGTETASITQKIPIVANTSYIFGGLIKASNVVTVSPNGSSIFLRWLDTTSTPISISQIMTAISGTVDWTNYEGTVMAPTNAAFVQVLCVSTKSTGKTWFDDIYLY